MIKTHKHTWQYFETTCLIEDYGDTFKVLYVEEERISPLQIENFNYLDNTTTYSSVKCLEFERKLIKFQVGRM